MTGKIRILSLDGGGIRGIIPATVMEYVESKIQQITNNPNARIADYFDLVVGTSTGGILGCFYLTPNPNPGPDKPSVKYKAGEALEFYTLKGKSIFNDSKKHTWFGLRQLVNATAYSPENLEKIFLQEFGNLKMSELVKRCVVTTYNMAGQSSFFFNSREEAHKKRDFLVRDVVRSTSAAPTYFPAAKIRNLITQEVMINIDGGVFANNPAMCAFAEAQQTKFSHIQFPSPKEMLVLSVGTGGGSIEFKDLDNVGNWGAINWAKSAPDIMMDGSLDTVEFQMKLIFGTLDGPEKLNYKRVDVPADQRKYSPNMADASEENIKKLKDAGRIALGSALDKNDKEHDLDHFIELLVKN